MHGQQNDKYTEMHGQQNDKYTEMHGQQNIKNSPRNSWLDEECQIMLEDKKRVSNKMISRNTRQNEQKYKDKRKEGHKIFRQKR
jgi:hypothetical protein